LPVCNRLNPRLESLLLEVFNHGSTFVSEKYIKYILLFSGGDPNLGVVIDVLVDDVVAKGDFLEGLGTSDDNLTSGEDARGNLLHVLSWLELDLDGGVSVRFK